MSALTVSILEGKQRRSRLRKWPKRFAEIADRLVAAYGVPTLGNYEDPVKEIFYIVLSAKTTDAQYRRTHAALTTRFPSLIDLSLASVEEIAGCIAGGGLANKKAAQIHRVAAKLLELGDDPASRLRSMSAASVYSFLTNLPGVGPKSALCIMMCSLSFDVFPVDVNVSRIAIRLGAVAPGLKHYHYQKLLPPMIPEGRSKELHVGLVVHGRTVCLPRKPECPSCPIADLCAVGRGRLRQQRGTGHGEGSENSAQTQGD
jgi:endonuclease III